MLEPGAEINAVRPDIDVALQGKIAALPALVFVLPDLDQTPDRGRRKTAGLRAEEYGQSLLELAGRNAFQIEPGQQFLDILGSPQISRQHRRREPDRWRIAGATVTNARPLDLDWSDTCLDPALGRVTIANNPLAALIVDQIAMAFNKGIDLGLNGLHQHPSRALAQKAKQRIIFNNTTWPRQADNGIFSHGVSFHR